MIKLQHFTTPIDLRYFNLYKNNVEIIIGKKNKP